MLKACTGRLWERKGKSLGRKEETAMGIDSKRKKLNNTREIETRTKMMFKFFVFGKREKKTLVFELCVLLKWASRNPVEMNSFEQYSQTKVLGLTFAITFASRATGDPLLVFAPFILLLFPTRKNRTNSFNESRRSDPVLF